MAVADGTAPGDTPIEASWFNPFAITSFDGFTEAILLSLFIYWGWDTCLALNEETKDPKRIPGQAALLSTVILVVTYVARHRRRDGLRGPRRGGDRPRQPGQRG